MHHHLSPEEQIQKDVDGIAAAAGQVGLAGSHEHLLHSRVNSFVKTHDGDEAAVKALEVLLANVNKVASSPTGFKHVNETLSSAVNQMREQRPRVPRPHNTRASKGHIHEHDQK